MSDLKPQIPPYSPVQALNLYSINQELRKLYEMIWSFHRETGLVNPEGSVNIAAKAACSAYLGANFSPSTYNNMVQISGWEPVVAATDNAAFTWDQYYRDAMVTESGIYFFGSNFRILQNTAYAANYFVGGLYQNHVLIDGTSNYVNINGNDSTGRTMPLALSTIVYAEAGDEFAVYCRDGSLGSDHTLQSNGTNFLLIKLS